MLETLLGSLSKERILFYLAARKEGYAREISRYYKTGLTPIQKQLEKLEYGSVVYAKQAGRTRVYRLNPRYPFYSELKSLLDKAIAALPDDELGHLINIRKRPRRKGKPI